MVLFGRRRRKRVITGFGVPRNCQSQRLPRPVWKIGAEAESLGVRRFWNDVGDSGDGGGWFYGHCRESLCSAFTLAHFHLERAAFFAEVLIKLWVLFEIGNFDEFVQRSFESPSSLP